MKSSVTKSFRKEFKDLPASVRKQAIKAYKLWQKDSSHPSLQFKRVSQRQPIFCSYKFELQNFGFVRVRLYLLVLDWYAR